MKSLTPHCLAIIEYSSILGCCQHNLKDDKSLTFVSTKAQVALPAAHVNERDKRIDIGPTASATDDHT